MKTPFTLTSIQNTPWINFFKNNFFLVILFLPIFIFIITTCIFAFLWKNKSSSTLQNKFPIENGIIGFPPILPNDGKYIQWTFLQLNDVYEMLPLDEGRKGGLARVAHLRQLLKKKILKHLQFYQEIFFLHQH